MSDALPASFIVTPESWTRELPLEGLFGDRKPLEVDVGCGKGRFLTAKARRQPDRNFLGIDRLLARLRKVDRKLTRHALTNVRLLRIEAAYAVQHLLPPDSVSVFYILFPDPWPKRRHHRRRLFSPEFCNALDRSLEPGGRLYVATDQFDYFTHIYKILTGDDRFREIEPYRPDEDEQTDFERIFLAKGLEIGRCGFRTCDSSGETRQGKESPVGQAACNFPSPVIH